MVVGLVALILLSWTSSTKPNSGITMGLGSSKSQSKAASGSNDVQQGVVGGIPYLHCGGGASQTASTTDVVLLHGARFTKEDWSTSGILEKLCVDFAVTALDLDKTAGHLELKHVLDVMKADSLLSMTKLPAIVTPSASGNTIVDWLDNVSELKQYVGKWIPVAPPSVGKATEDQLKQLADMLPILAIYGDKDSGGKIVSDKLGRFSQAKVIEITGSHPCYLDSPDDFVKRVKAFLV
jgi:pimeloyl-ACP methyl ester carboxylesterase